MFPQRLRRWLCSVVGVVVVVRNFSDPRRTLTKHLNQIAMVAVVAVAVEVEAVEVMVILTMGSVVVVTMATAAGVAIDGNCLLIGWPILSRCSLRAARLCSLGGLDAHCAPSTHPLRPQIVAVSIRVQ